MIVEYNSRKNYQQSLKNIKISSLFQQLMYFYLNLNKFLILK